MVKAAQGCRAELGPWLLCGAPPRSPLHPAGAEKTGFTLHHGPLMGDSRWIWLGQTEKHCTKVTMNDKMIKTCTLPLIPTKTVRPKQTKKTANTRTKWRLESVYSRMGASLQSRSQWVRGRQGAGSDRRRPSPPASPHLQIAPTLKPDDPPDKSLSDLSDQCRRRVTFVCSGSSTP